MSVLRLTIATLHLMSSRITHSQVKESNNNDAHTLFVCLSWTFWSNKLNVYALEAPFQEEIWSPPSELAFMTVNIVKQSTQALVYMSSVVHKVRHIEHQFMSLRCPWRLSNIECCTVFSKINLIIFTCLSLSTWSNNAVYFHAVAGYFKCRLLPYRTLKGIEFFNKNTNTVVQ